MKEFWQNFEVEQKDLSYIKEEALAERVALSVLKSGEAKGTAAEKVLSSNEFAAPKDLIKALN